MIFVQSFERFLSYNSSHVLFLFRIDESFKFFDIEKLVAVSVRSRPSPPIQADSLIYFVAVVSFLGMSILKR